VQYFINAYACDIVGVNQTGGNREGLNFQSIGNITIPLPTLSEQERIVKYLDAETGKIDRAIEVKRRQIALLRERREIAINEVVTGKVKVA
jgi:type I restriction enzyme S subunit